MKVKQLRAILDEVAQQKDAAGDEEIARALRRLSKLAKPQDSQTVAALAKQIKALP